jgi:hypothetical protein
MGSLKDTKPHIPCTGKWGLRASHLLDPRRVYGPKTMKSLYLNAEVIARNRREEEC